VRVAVVAAGRGDLPFASLHGEPLLAHAVRTAQAAVEAEVVVLVDEASRADAAAVVVGSLPTLTAAEWWSSRSAAAELVHDALCPLAPASLLAEVAAAAGSGRAVAAYRPVTDTVKTARDDRIEGTIDRDGLGIVVAPVLVPRAVGNGEPAPPLDLARLVDWLRARTTVDLVRSPSLARRVHDLGSVALLECVDEMARRTRH
jgi:2-C-methyl-D-erythritol 4-phosphate cytidylyltransferase